MMVMELVACRLLEDPAFPAPMKGYVVTFVAFYEQGFGMPSLWFLRFLLRHYGLELHNLTPLGVLHIATSVTLCEAYMGIDPKFDLWNYFFHARRPQDPDRGLIVYGGIVIHVKFGHGVDPYFNIPMPRLMKRWWKKWFYLMNDAFTQLPAFTGNRPIPLSS
jgi:hypothetical protein